ncbi:MAG: polyprenyl synthetase family protein [Candidatus Moraniibacteriota bacterium]
MDIQTTLRDFKARLDPKIAAYFDATLAEAKQEDELVYQALEHVKTMTLAGGKRLRPAFMYYGYLAAGGDDRERLLDTAVAVELIHTFLLIHDDIIDRDALRHGQPTLHERYRAWGKQYLSLEHPEHFGDSIALIVGDMLFALGNDIIFTSGFPEKHLYAALSRMQRIVSQTVVGQARDIYIEYRGEATSTEILEMYEKKTARYTVEGPLHLGALLAGGTPELAAELTRYALPVGIAFQIQDDILGMYGDETRIGKPIGSDIREGKITLLVSYIFEHADRATKKEVAELLKRGAELTTADVERFRVIVRETGALDEAKNLALRYIHEGKQTLDRVQAPIAPEAREFLLGVADYMAKREY